METPITVELRNLTRKMEILAAQRDDVIGKLRNAEEEISDLRRELEETRTKLHESRLDVEYLTVSHRLADNPGALAEARNTVRKMMAEVDEAIALLKSDAQI